MFWILATVTAALLSGLAGWHIGGHPVALVFTVAGGTLVLGLRDILRHKHALAAGTVLAGLAGWYFFGWQGALAAIVLSFPVQLSIHDFSLRKNALLPVAGTFTLAAWMAGYHYFNGMTGLIFGLVTFLLVIFVDDCFLQRKHAIRRNFPLLGWCRYGFELIGDELRQYWFMSDTEEKPYDRHTRQYIYRSAKGINNNVGFGTSRGYRDVGEIHMLNAMFPVPEATLQGNRIRPLVIGKKRRKPYACPWPINISGMSWGALSAEAVQALASGAKLANIHMLTGEGGLTPYHQDGVIKRIPFGQWLSYWKKAALWNLGLRRGVRPVAPVAEVVGGGRIIVQLGPAKFGFRRVFTDAFTGPEGRGFRKRFSSELDIDKLRQVAQQEQIVGFEIKLAQGAKPGQGGKLPKEKITPELAEWRGIPMGVDCYSPNAWEEFSDVPSMFKFVTMLQEVTGKPVGIKIVVGQVEPLEEIAKLMATSGQGPDFITIDGGEGGTGAAPAALADHMGLPILHAIPAVDTIFRQHGVRNEVVLIASGQIATGADVAIAIAMGADMVNIGRGNMIAEGCIMAKRCHSNTCPVGIATQNPRLRRGLDAQDKYRKVANYNKVLQRELLMILKAVGVRHPWELNRHHLKVVTSPMVEEYMDAIHPYPNGDAGRAPLLGELPGDDPEELDRFGPKLIKLGIRG